MLKNPNWERTNQSTWISLSPAWLCHIIIITIITIKMYNIIVYLNLPSLAAGDPWIMHWTKMPSDLWESVFPNPIPRLPPGSKLINKLLNVLIIIITRRRRRRKISDFLKHLTMKNWDKTFRKSTLKDYLSMGNPIGVKRLTNNIKKCPHLTL